ncbi:MAG: hypothetical protein QW728_06940, partial [Thermoplasmata archaeon]
MPISAETIVANNTYQKTTLFISGYNWNQTDNFKGSSLDFENNDGNPYTFSTTPADSHFILEQSGIYYMAHRITEKEVEEMKIKYGVRDMSKNYNEKIVVGGTQYGTGLAPLSEQEYNSLIGNVVIDYVLDSKGYPIISEEQFDEIYGSRASADLSTQPYFPAIGNQSSQGSCAAWAMTYYCYGYLEAKDNNWNRAKTGDPTQLMSPGWTYNKANARIDTGSSCYGNGDIIAQIGAATLANMPFNEYDSYSWGDPPAWREAPLHRAKEVVTISFNGDATISTLKSLVASGYPVTFAMNAQVFLTAFNDGNYIVSA